MTAPQTSQPWQPLQYGVRIDQIEANHFNEICGFLEKDAKNPPSKHAVIFIGSSTIRIWGETSLHESMAPIPCIARGFGGSKSFEAIYFFDEIVRPHNPAAIVFFSGTNDLNSRVASADEVIQSTQDFFKLVAKEIGPIPIIYMGITKTPSTREIWPEMERVNRYIHDLAEEWTNLSYMETNDCVADQNGFPRLECFQQDEHHLSPFGYASIAPSLKALIRKQLPKAI
jgi:hypothetical protein